MSNINDTDYIIENIELVIFDKDGTLIDIHKYWYHMIKARAEYISLKYLDNNLNSIKELMDLMGIDLHLKKIKPEGPVGIKPRKYIINLVVEYLQLMKLNVNFEDIANDFITVDVITQSKLSSILELLPGVSRFLENLRRSNIKTAIATTDLTERAVLACEVLSIKSNFDIIVGADLVKNSKPSPDLVDKIIGDMNIQASRTLVIGDSIPDLGMARNSGVKFVGVLTGLYNEEFIKNAEYISKDMTYLLANMKNTIIIGNV